MDLLDKMATYVRVVEAGSFSAAARQLRISPAAVSRQIATLEGELRLPLLRRSTRRMAVTPDGRHYYERCLRILREVDDAQALGRGGATAGFLSVSAPVTFGLAAWCRSCRRCWPRIRAYGSTCASRTASSTWRSTASTWRFASAARRRTAPSSSRTRS